MKRINELQSDLQLICFALLVNQRNTGSFGFYSVYAYKMHVFCSFNKLYSSKTNFRSQRLYCNTGNQM